MVRASRLLVAYNLHTTRDKLARVSSYKTVVHTTPHCTPIQELCEILSEHAKNCRHLRLDSERWTVNCPDNGDVDDLQLSVYYDVVENFVGGVTDLSRALSAVIDAASRGLRVGDQDPLGCQSE
jgi:hypothetical protein